MFARRMKSAASVRGFILSSPSRMRRRNVRRDVSSQPRKRRQSHSPRREPWDTHSRLIPKPRRGGRTSFAPPGLRAWMWLVNPRLTPWAMVIPPLPGLDVFLRRSHVNSPWFILSPRSSGNVVRTITRIVSLDFLLLTVVALWKSIYLRITSNIF